MKKKRFAWFALLVLILNLLVPFKQVYDVFADEQNTTSGNVLDTENVSIDYIARETQEGINWTFDYVANADVEKKQRLKIEFIADGRSVAFDRKEGWNYSDNWFVQDEFTEKSKGSISVFTSSTILSVSLRIQGDTEEISEDAENTEPILLKDVFSREIEGLHELKVPVILVEEEEEINTETSPQQDSDLDSDSTESTVDEPIQDDSEGNIEEILDENISDSLDAEDSETIVDEPDDTEKNTESDTEVNYHKVTAVPFSFARAGSSSSTDPFGYEDNSNGIYPIKNTNNYENDKTAPDIKNYDFSQPGSEGTSTIKNVYDSGALNFDNGYHYYEDAGYVKKLVIPTDDPTKFKIQLDMIGEQLTTDNPIDIAIVLDDSASMNYALGNSTRWSTLKQTVENFADTLIGDSTVNNDNIRIGLANFGSVGTGTAYTNIGKFNNGTTAFTSDYNTLINSPLLNKNSASSNSGTPTFLGIDAGYLMLTDTQYQPRANAAKVLIVVTDGAPTFRPGAQYTNLSGLTKSSENQNRRDYYAATNSWNNQQFAGNGSSPEYSSTITHVNNRAAANPNILKYAIGIATDNNTRPTLNAIGQNGMYEASNQEQLANALSQIATSLSRSIQNANLIDPMSQYVTLDTSSAKVYDLAVGTNSITATPSSKTVSTSNNQVSIGDIALGAKEGLRVEYEVTLKDDYWDGKFYPANGTTYLENNKTDSPEYLHFAVPSVRYDTFTIPVEKKWEDENNKYNLRKDIVIQLQSRINDQWQDVAGKVFQISAGATDNQLKGTFTQIRSKDSSGQPIIYRIVERANGTEKAVEGYQSPSYSAPREITFQDVLDKKVTNDKPLAVTNELLKTEITFTKVGHDNTTILEGAEFTLFAEDGETPIGVATSNGSGVVVFDQQVPIGKYIIKETNTPLGYETHEDIEITVTSENNVLVVSGFPEGEKVQNILKDFELIITKLDIAGKAVFGVKFMLEGPDGSQEELEADDPNGNVFTFQNLKPGEYTLTETQTPNSYVGLENPVIIVISYDGTVTIDGEEKENVLTVDGNIITLEVNNTPKGLLPSTGGTGRQIFLIGSIAVLGMTGLIGGYYVYRNRKGAQ